MVEIYLTFMGLNSNKTATGKACLNSFGAQYPFFFSNIETSEFTGADFYIVFPDINIIRLPVWILIIFCIQETSPKMYL